MQQPEGSSLKAAMQCSNVWLKMHSNGSFSGLGFIAHRCRAFVRSARGNLLPRRAIERNGGCTRQGTASWSPTRVTDKSSAASSIGGEFAGSEGARPAFFQKVTAACADCL